MCVHTHSYIAQSGRADTQFLIVSVAQVSFRGNTVCFAFSKRKPWIYDIRPHTK